MLSRRTPGHPLLDDIEGCLRGQQPSAIDLSTILDKVMCFFECATGTLHGLEPDSGLLQLRAHRGLPDTLLPRVEVIPLGKGMAGLAAQSRQPVQVCNLQTDSSGVANPAARQTSMEGSIAVPSLVDGQVCGVLGVAKPVVYEFSPEEIALLQQVANSIGRALVPPERAR